MFPVKAAARRYAIEAFVALGLLGLLVRVSRIYAPQIADPTLHTSVAFLPFLAICLFALSLLRLYLALDEMQRHQALVIIASAQLLMLILNMSYRWLPDAGLPPLHPGVPINFICILLAGAMAAMWQLLRHRDRAEAFLLARIGAFSIAPILIYVLLAQTMIVPPLNVRVGVFLLCAGLAGFGTVRALLGRKRR